MRDPARIKRMLALIERIWLKDPDLRLMQLLGNTYNSGCEYQIEDRALEIALRDTYGMTGP